MARLEGPEHNAFFAIEAPDSETVELQIEKLRGFGTNIDWWLIRCVSENCFGAFEIKPFIILNPSKLPPFAYYLLLKLEGEHIREEVRVAREHLGQDGVAAATDGKGRFLVELASNDEQALDAAVNALAAANKHAVSPDGILRG